MRSTHFTQASHLNKDSRDRAFSAMTDEEGVDILIIGGGVTGAGIALDAATRGLRTAIIEKGDWANGTSSWSSKLVHGGLRYLYNLDFKLVAEALKERSLLLEKTAPHLVKAQPFLWPLKMPVIERAYSAVGIGMYDTMAFAGARGHRTVPAQKHFTKKGAKKIFPDIKNDVFTGAIQFYDARVDDARLVVDLVRTAAGYGALAASRVELTNVLKNNLGTVVGAEVRNLENGESATIKAKHIINATGVWTEETESLAHEDAGLEVLASKGIHILVPRDRIKATSGIFTMTEKSVLFVIPWQRYWIIGTTDTPYTEDINNPVATADDIQYVLDEANRLLANELTKDDIIGTYAGLRPLLQPKLKEGSEASSTKVSREHTVTQIAPGMSAIAGGKLTTYRVMAEDAVDFALGSLAKARPSVTESIELVGAAGYSAAEAQRANIAQIHGWNDERMTHLLERYGSDIHELLALIEEDASLATPLTHAPQFLRADVLFGVRFEGALHLEDILIRRVRLDLEQRDRGLSSAEEIIEIMSDELGWDAATEQHELDTYKARVDAIAAAENETTDAAATGHLSNAQSVVSHS